jgi:hypothetical protein
LRKVTFLGKDALTPERGSMKLWIQNYWEMSDWHSIYDLFDLSFFDIRGLSIITTPYIELALLTDYGRNEALNYLKGCDRLVVIPSLNENLPYAVLESIVHSILLL